MAVGDSGVGGGGGVALYNGEGGMEDEGVVECDGDAVVAIELVGASNILLVTTVLVCVRAIVVFACTGGGLETTTAVGETMTSALSVRALV